MFQKDFRPYSVSVSEANGFSMGLFRRCPGLLHCVLRFDKLLLVAVKNLWWQKHGNWHQSDGGFCVQADAGES